MQMPVLAGEEYLMKQRLLRRGSKLGIMLYKTIAVTYCIIVILEKIGRDDRQSNGPGM